MTLQLDTIDLDTRVRYASFGGEGPRTLVLVHGLGGSLVNWAAVGHKLAALGRVFALDLSGFGRSEWRPGSATVGANRALLGRFIRRVAPGPVVLVGNSMGGLLSMLQAAAEPSTVAALALVCPGLVSAPPGSHDREITAHFTLSTLPIIGEYYTRKMRREMTPEQGVDRMLQLCGVDTARLDRKVLAMHHEVARARLEQPWSVPAHTEAARSVMAHLFAMPLHVRKQMLAVRAPTLLLQGLDDRLVLPQMTRTAARTCPAWHLDELPGVGHVPMLQEPDLFVERLSAWMRRAVG